MLVTLRGMVMELNLTESLKALSLMAVTRRGTVSCSSASQCRKAEAGMVVMPAPSFTSVRASQS